LDKFAYRPIRSKFAELGDKILIEEKKVGSNIRNLMQREAISKEHKKISNYVTTIGTDEKEMSEFLKVVEETSRNSNIYMTDIKPQPVIKVNFYKKYIVEVDAEAPMDRLIDFMYRLESVNQLINIDSFQLSREKEGSKVIKGHIVITKILVP